MTAALTHLPGFPLAAPLHEIVNGTDCANQDRREEAIPLSPLEGPDAGK